MDHPENLEAKERIINASKFLFSKMGYDATRVSEIANEANVTKALIYYYFKNKEEILDYLVQSLLKSTTSITLDFIYENIVAMIKDGRLDIEADRLKFTDDKSITEFVKNYFLYYEQVMDFALENKSIFRILMLESLKNSKHHNELFKFIDFTINNEDNPIYKTISDADSDFNYSDDMVFFRFFFSILPIVNFAAYYDDYKKRTSLSDKKLRDFFLSSHRTMLNSLVSGKDILLRSKNITE